MTSSTMLCIYMIVHSHNSELGSKEEHSVENNTHNITENARQHKHPDDSLGQEVPLNHYQHYDSLQNKSSNHVHTVMASDYKNSQAETK